MARAVRPCEGQAALDLFGPPRRRPIDESLRWLVRVWGCREEDVMPHLRRLYAEFAAWDADERAKVLVDFYWPRHKPAFDGLTPEQVGMYDRTIDYHTAWDRCWAIRRGMDPREALRVVSWDYGNDRPSRTAV